jgi:hypothetical protein
MIIALAMSADMRPQDRRIDDPIGKKPVEAAFVDFLPRFPRITRSGPQLEIFDSLTGPHPLGISGVDFGAWKCKRPV